jgi:ankyrin repeat protein
MNDTKKAARRCWKVEENELHFIGTTALHVAAKGGHLEVVRELVSAKTINKKKNEL